MAKKRTLMSSEERKAQILEKVTQTFAQKGFAGTRTTDLAKAAGVSQALIYKLFGDKQGLYRAMIESRLERLEQSVLGRGPDPAQEDDDEAFFGQVAELLLESTRKDPAWPRLLLYSELSQSSFSKLFRELHSGRAITTLSAYIERRVAAGAFKDVDPSLAAWSFLGMVWQYALSAYVFEVPFAPKVDETEAAQTFTRLFLDGMRRPPARTRRGSK